MHLQRRMCSYVKSQSYGGVYTDFGLGTVQIQTLLIREYNGALLGWRSTGTLPRCYPLFDWGTQWAQLWREEEYWYYLLRFIPF